MSNTYIISDTPRFKNVKLNLIKSNVVEMSKKASTLWHSHGLETPGGKEYAEIIKLLTELDLEEGEGVASKRSLMPIMKVYLVFDDAAGDDESRPELLGAFSTRDLALNKIQDTVKERDTFMWWYCIRPWEIDGE